MNNNTTTCGAVNNFIDAFLAGVYTSTGERKNTQNNMDIGIGLSQKDNSISAAQEALERARSNLKSPRVDLALVFASPDLSSSSLLQTVTEALQNTPVLGISGKALICGSDTFKHGAAIMLLSFPDGKNFHVANTINIARRAQLAGEEMGEKLAAGLKDLPRSLGVIFCDQLMQEGVRFLHGLQGKIGRNVPLLGACPSGSTFLENHLYFNQYVTSDACVGMLLSDKIGFGIGLKHGWKPIGQSYTVTKSNNNVIETINGSAATKFYQGYLGYDWSKLKNNLRLISTLYPLGIYLSEEKEYVLRNIVSLGSGGSIAFSGDIPQDSVVRFMVSTKETCLDAAKDAASEAYKNLLSHPAARSSYAKKAAVVFSSISRHRLLGREAKKEITAIKEIVGNDTPTIGVYTQGEIAPMAAAHYRGKAYFHNQTVTILILGG